MANTGTTTQPLSAINRFSSVSGAVSGPVVNFNQISKQDEILWRISRNSRALRGGRDAGGTLNLALKGRSDALKALLTRYGIIPIHTHVQGAATLHSWLQAFPSHRGVFPGPTAETIGITIDAGTTTFAEDGPAVDQLYGSSGLRGLATTVPPGTANPNDVGRTQVIVP
jgi:hypothetical protein